MNLISWAVRSCSSRGGDGVNGVNEGCLYLASFEYYFIKRHENLLQHPSKKSIFKIHVAILDFDYDDDVFIEGNDNKIAIQDKIIIDIHSLIQ